MAQAGRQSIAETSTTAAAKTHASFTPSTFKDFSLQPFMCDTVGGNVHDSNMAPDV